MINPLDLIARPQTPNYFNQLAMIGSNLARSEEMRRRQAQQEAQRIAGTRAISMLGQKDAQPIEVLSGLVGADPFSQRVGLSMIENQRQAQKLQDPRVIEAARRQQDAYFAGQNLISQAIENPEKASEYMKQYTELQRQNLEADATLTALGVPSHGKYRMGDFDKVLANVAEYRVAPQLTDIELAQKQAEAGLIGAETQRTLAQTQTAQAQAVKAQEEAKKAKEGTGKEKSIVALAKRLIKEDEIIAGGTKGDAWKQTLTRGIIPSRFSLAADRFSEAILRDKSGAAIGIQEAAEEKGRYIPGPLDTPDILQDKAQFREFLINQLLEEAGGANTIGKYRSKFVKPSDSDEQPKSTGKVLDITDEDRQFLFGK